MPSPASQSGFCSACDDIGRVTMASASAQRDTTFSIDSSLQQRLDIGFEIFGLGRGREAIDHIALAVDQELGEVPFDGFAAEQAPGAALEPAIQRMGGLAVHFDFLEHGK